MHRVAAPTVQALLQRGSALVVMRRLLSTTGTIRPAGPLLLAMKPGAPIPGLDFLTEQDPPVARPRDDYPDWVNDLAKRRVTLAELRRMPIEEATDRDKMRYLKLTRRIRIKEKNTQAGA